MDLRIMSKELIAEFIELYRSLPCLWDIRRTDYKDREKRALAYEQLIAKLQEEYPEANKQMVVKKIDSMRTTFKKEHSLVIASHRFGTEIYKPQLWYYEQMLFLKDIRKRRLLGTELVEDECEDEVDCIATGNESAVKTNPGAAAIKLDTLDATAKVWACKLHNMPPTQRAYAEQAMSAICFQGQLGTLTLEKVQKVSAMPFSANE